MTVKTFLPLSLLDMVSIDGGLKYSRLIALLRSFGSRQRRKDPSFFSTITRLLTQSLGLSDLLITPVFSSLASVSFSFGIRLRGTFLGGWIFGCASSFISMWYSPATCPRAVKTSLNSSRMSRSFLFGISLTVIRFSSWQEFNPRSGFARCRETT